jgi:uncharacterized protein YndB with AHSA1/START domain
VYTPRTIFVTYIVSTPDKVWAALTSTEFTRQYFFGRRVESDWKVGSTVRYRMEDGTLDVEGKVLESDPPRLLSITWHLERTEELRRLPENLVTFKIDALGEVVRLTMSESHREGIDEKLLEGGRRGWPIILCGIKTLLETGKPMPAFDYTK